MADCVGHFGHVKLSVPAFHVGYFKHIIACLQEICKDCSRILLTESQKRSFLKELRRPGIDNLRRSQICKKINEQCKKMRRCASCGNVQGVIKKAGALKIIHERFRHSGKKDVPEEIEFKASFAEALKTLPDLKQHVQKAQDDMNPLKVLALFKAISPVDCELLGMDPNEGRPEMFLWQYVPAPPVCIRPSVTQDGGVNEDDLTVKLTEIISTSAHLKAALDKGTPIGSLIEQWDYLQLSIAMYINSDMPGVPLGQVQKPIRGFCQRLKGKTGRFRGNLSGKRVDFSGRTVIGPDPNLAINQVAVPERIAKTLTYPEKVTAHNLEKLKQCVVNGPEKHPGANFLIGHSDGFKRFLRFGDRNKIADGLQIGDVVERHIHDGDCILFNRQPSLHKLSIMCHFAKIRPWRTLRLNECACGPYGADFDGDEMNLHVPQTEEARTEAMVLMGVKNNLVTPKNGEPIIAAIQDFITASFLLSRKDIFFDRAKFTQTVSMMMDANEHIDLPPPTILKPVALWTGKQVFGLLMRPNKKSKVVVNLEAKCRSFAGVKGEAPDMCPNDGYLVIRGSQVMCGVMDKSTVGDGKKDSLFYVILRDYGPDEAIAAMSRLAKLCARHLGNQGFSLGISDVQASARLRNEKDQLVEKAYSVCDDLIRQMIDGKLETQAGCNEEQTLEAKISGVLSKVRDNCGEICMQGLEPTNAPIIMATCGSKGSKINVSQMVSCVGQQIISGSRVPNGFQDRSLPHFPKNSKNPPSRGFVRNSFYTGLSPPEFLFHAISGREGLVDTAVKTAETGYMSRRLMKSLEDLSAQYDGSVRNSSSGIVQFTYGDDGLDPTYLEGDGFPVEFIRTWKHCENLSIGDTTRSLYPFEVNERTEKYISRPEFNTCTADFTESVKAFIFQHIASRMATIREAWGLTPMLQIPAGHKTGSRANLDRGQSVESIKSTANALRVTEPQLVRFLKICLHKYIIAKVEPGTAVGAVGAQSIGEPGTQMTLKTFHFAGVASMNITLGVPRIKEIINAAKSISTPIITCTLVNENDLRSARVVKGRIEKTYLEDITSYVEEVFGPTNSYVGIRIDWATINKLQLEIDMAEIAHAIITAPKLKVNAGKVTVVGSDRIRVYVNEDDVDKDNVEVYYKLQWFKRVLPKVIVKGITTINRAVINERSNQTKELLVEGYGLKDVMCIEGIVGQNTYSNHIIEMKSVLGIEAARGSIIREVSGVMKSHGMNVDPRHIMLLGDVMTYKGEILGITRFGIAKMKDSVLMLASFEKTTDHLFDAAARLAQDAIEGVSECIILGVAAPVGTGAFKLIRRTEMESSSEPKKLLFDVPELH